MTLTVPIQQDGRLPAVGTQHVPDRPPDVIRLEGMTKVYDPTPRWMRAFARTHVTRSVRALDSVDLRVGAGEICAIVGPNGAGKTTLFRVIVGLTDASGGTGSVLGHDVQRDSERVRRVVGWMPSEDRSLLMRATCTENLQLHGRLQGMSRQHLARRIGAVLEMVDLGQQRHSVVASLSAGMKARLRLARAMLPQPRALILDEPTGAVDPIAAHGLLNLITELVREEQLAVVISSHRLEEIEALRSQAMLLDHGRVKYSGDLDTLRARWETPELEITFDSPSVASDAAQRLGVAGYEASLDHAVLRCLLRSDSGVGPVIAALGPVASSIEHIQEKPMPLRDLIARVYGEREPAGGER